MHRPSPKSTLFPYTTLFRSYQGTNNSTTFLNGTINNTGTILINAAANFTDLRIADGTMLTGGGSVLLSDRSEEHTSELQSRQYHARRLLHEKKKGAGQIGVG